MADGTLNDFPTLLAAAIANGDKVYLWDASAATSVGALVSEFVAALALLGLVADADLAAHEADTTSVHGIADTSTLYRAGGTDVAVADGGTGASTAAGARTALDVPSNAEAVLDAIFDAKGDLIAGTAPDTPTRVPVGADGQVLTADAAEATGIKWAAPAAAGVSDAAYGAPWDGDTANAPSKNAVYDKIETLAPLASPALTGTPTAPTASPGDDDTSIATTAFVNAEIAADAVLKSEFAAAGDVLIGTGAGALDNLAIGTAAGKAPTADPNATNKISIQFPMSIEEAHRGTSGALASTYDRAHGEANDAPLATGRLNCSRIILPKGLSIANISFFSMTTAGASMTNQWFALFDSSKAKLAVTADDGSTAWAANTQKTLAVASGPFVTTYTGWYWLGICVVGTTMPSLAAQTAIAGTSAKIKNPLPAGAFDSGLTNPASCPNPFGSAVAATGLAYAEVS